MPYYESEEWSESFPGVMHHVPITRESGAGAVTMGRVRMAPGATLPPHSHPVEDAMFIVAGSGEFHLGDEVVHFVPGSAILVPANMVHWVTNTGDEELDVIFTWPAVDVARVLHG